MDGSCPLRGTADRTHVSHARASYRTRLRSATRHRPLVVSMVLACVHGERIDGPVRLQISARGPARPRFRSGLCVRPSRPRRTRHMDFIRVHNSVSAIDPDLLRRRRFLNLSPGIPVDQACCGDAEPNAPTEPAHRGSRIPCIGISQGLRQISGQAHRLPSARLSAFSNAGDRRTAIAARGTGKVVDEKSGSRAFFRAHSPVFAISRVNIVNSCSVNV